MTDKIYNLRRSLGRLFFRPPELVSGSRISQNSNS